jgi:LmbE family N-acetylglucosaminyl deacetylase
MNDSKFTRRTFLGKTGIALAPLLASVHAPPLAAAAAQDGRRLNVLCVGGHPDDPESGCAGTLTRYVELGHSVTVLYLTRGERGIRDKGLDESAKTRTAECEKACQIIGAAAKFFGQIDGATEVTRPHVDAMTQLLAELKPDVMFTHWPVDTHMDHQVASMLVIRAWMASGEQPELYFFEVNTGDQSQGFLPNTYVDVTTVLEKKKAALLAHLSQDGEGIWRQHHEVIAKWRGREAGVAMAEAFVHLSRKSKFSKLPGI